MSLWDIFTAPFKMLIEGFANLIDYMVEKIFTIMVKEPKRRERIVKQINDEVFVHSIKPEMFRTELMQKEVKKLKEKAKHEHTSIVDWLDGFLTPYIGQATPDVLFKQLGIDVSEMPMTVQNFIKVMDLIADLGVLTGYIDIIATAVSGTLVRKIGSFVDRIVNYSGLNYVTGYGMGTALGNAITPFFTYNINKQLLPKYPDFKTIFDAHSRFKVGKTALYDHMKLYGINPDTELPLTEEEMKLDYGTWYSTESILNNLTNPEKWEKVPIKTYGDMYHYLAQSPVSYFILNNVAESGFYNRKLFSEALRDSSYGALATGLILMGSETAFIKRHMTKYEDELNDMYLAGELSFEEYKEALKDIYPSEDMVNTISSFFKNKWIRTRRIGVKTLVTEGLKSGRLSEAEARTMLVNAGYKPEYIDLIMDMIKDSIKSEKELTMSQLCRIAKEGIWSVKKVMERLIRSGYEPDEAQALLKLYMEKTQWKTVDKAYEELKRTVIV